jgi:exopolysaccharide biosynthesis WecB/TagA/CpsF family protein
MLERKKGKFQLIPVFQRLALLHQIRQTDITLVLSDYMKSNLVRNGWSKDSIHKLYPISNVIEPPPFTHTKADTPVILYVGQLIKGKGIDLLLQALSRISIPYQCCIVGSGNAEANLKELAAKLNLSNKLSWIGWTDDIDAYYAKAQLVVVPSRWQEPFGLIGIEAFAHSIPVVGFDVGGISEWLKHKVNGLLARENDIAGMAKAITTLITNPEKAHQYGLAGNLMVQREYSEAGFIERFSALCQSLSVADIAGGIENPDPKISIFGISFINATMSHALGLVESRIEKKIKTKFYFVNADCYNKIFIDKEYQTILAENDVIFPDGSGIKMAGKLLGKKVLDNVNGTDMLPLLCTLAAKKGYRIFLLGAAPGVAEQMKINLQQQYPGLCICGLHHGFFAWDTAGAEVTKQINAAKPDIVLVAFGAPLQEKWISRYFTETDAWILMGVGGLFDFYSGRIPRAPLWMRRLGIEWVFRLIQEPKRMWKRYILGNPLFLYRVWRWKNSNKGR